MAASDNKVMRMVERELKKDPDVLNAILLQKATKLEPAVAGLSGRQFNARHRLQVKRKAGVGSSKPKPTAKKPAPAAVARKPAPKRAKKAAKRKPEPPKIPSQRPAAPAVRLTDRSAIRRVFMDFASDLAAADDRVQVVRVLAGLDTYVDRAVKRL